MARTHATRWWALLWQSIFSRLAGYEDTNDVERLSVDPTMRHVVGGWAKAKQAASTSQMGLYETEVLTQPKNLSALMDLSGTWIDAVRLRKPVREIKPLLTRSVGRPSNKPVVWHYYILCQAGSWDRPRRVVANIEHHKGELSPRVEFIVTNLRRPSWRVVEFYNGRGTAEQWIKEGENAVKWTRLS